MSSHPDRDRAVERLLSSRRASPGEPFVLTPQCPEADVLAAWTDGGLEPARAAIVESHIAGCPRCEAIVAAVATSAPPEAASFWTRWRFAVPAFAAVAAAASIAVVVWSRREPASLPAPTEVTARVEPTPTPSMTPVPPLVPETPAASRPVRGAAANKPAPIVEPTPNAKPTPAKQPAEPKQARANGDFTEDKMNFDSTRAVSARPQPAAPPPPAELQPRNASQATAAGASAAQGVADRASLTAPPPPPPPAAPAAPTITVVAESPLVDTKKTTMGGTYVPAGAVAAFESENTPPPVTAQGSAGRGGRGGGGAGGVARPVKWLILASGQVERSFDNGSTWSAVALAPGQQAVAGVAPSRNECSIVGRGGMVLLMTDGQTFQATTRPTTVDLNFVRIEGARVIVSTVAGDTFVTTDSGRTWTKEGLLQGF